MEAILVTLSIGLMILLARNLMRIDRIGGLVEDLGIFSFKETPVDIPEEKKADA